MWSAGTFTRTPTFLTGHLICLLWKLYCVVDCDTYIVYLYLICCIFSYVFHLLHTWLMDEQKSYGRYTLWYKADPVPSLLKSSKIIKRKPSRQIQRKWRQILLRPFLKRLLLLINLIESGILTYSQIISHFYPLLELLRGTYIKCFDSGVELWTHIKRRNQVKSFIGSVIAGRFTNSLAGSQLR